MRLFLFFLSPLLPCAVLLRTRNKDDDGLTFEARMDGRESPLSILFKQTCSTPALVPLTMTTGGRRTRTLDGVQTTLFRCSKRFVGCALVNTSGTISFFFVLFCAFVTDGCLLACRRRRTKFPATRQHMELKAHSRSLEVRFSSTLKTNICKL